MKKLAYLLPVIFLAFHYAPAQLITRDVMARITGASYDIRNHEGDGFKAEYYNGANFEEKVTTRVEQVIDFFLINRSPLSGVNPHYFSVRWTGKLYAPKTGNYTFTFIADDGVRLWVNNVLVIDEWRLNKATAFSGNIHLTGKQLYNLKIEYSNMKPYAAAARCLWRFEEEPEQPINPKYLFSSPKQTIVPLAARKPVPPKTSVTASAKAPKKKTPVAKKDTPAPVVAKKEMKPPVTTEGGGDDAEVPDVEIFENLEMDKAVVLSRVLFDQSHPNLRSESFAELDKLANTLRQKPDMRIIVVGHTDNVGDFYQNVQLSKDRAKAVTDYLVKQGIAASRVAYKGYGSMYPVAPNTTEENKSKNRRVEFVVR